MVYDRRLIKDFRKSQRDHPDWPVVMSEGDSWFSFTHVIDRLDDPQNHAPRTQRPWSLLRMEKNGDEILAILSGGQRAILRNRFERWKFDALLFSAGGNDIIGPDLLPLLRPYVNGMQVQDLVAFSRFERRLRQIQDCYRELLDMLADAKQTTKVFVNSYDYTIPSDRPVKLIGIRLAGPWIIKYMAQRGIPADMHRDIVHLLIDGFVAAVKAVAKEPRGVGRLIPVETRNVVGTDWKDEIHPNHDGASRVAKVFENALNAEGII